MARIVKVTKEMAEERLGEVPHDKQFYFIDGKVAKNLSELESALQEMSDETFDYHSSETKSDFSNWVRDVIGDDKLSRDLQKSTSRAQAVKKVADRIAWLRNKTVVGN
jgi:hypothetical protein